MSTLNFVDTGLLCGGWTMLSSFRLFSPSFSSSFKVPSPSTTWRHIDFKPLNFKNFATQKNQKLVLPLGVQSPQHISLKLNQLADNPGARKKGRRVGRGIGSGRGKTAGRGSKGHRSRSGGGVSPQFEGGTTPLYKRARKYGFSNAK
jgi:hypothetical protein